VLYANAANGVMIAPANTRTIAAATEIAMDIVGNTLLFFSIASIIEVDT
jgi:hypothetical protein